MERFKSIFDELPIPIHIWQQIGNEFIFRYFNEANNALAGGKLQDMIGIAASEVHKNNPDLIENLHECARAKTEFSRDLTYKYKSSGVEKHLLVIYSFLPPDLVIAVTQDKTKLWKQEQTIKHKSKLQNLLSKISSRFVDLKDFNSSINESLEDIGKFSGASRSYLFLIDDRKKITYNSHEWCKPGVNPQLQNNQTISLEDIEWFLKTLKREKGVHIPDVSQLPPNTEKIRHILQKQDIKSLLNYPLYIGEELIGFIGFDDTEKTTEWDQEDFESLKITAEILGNALERKQNEMILENLTIELEKKVDLRTKELKRSEEQYRDAYEMANFYKTLIAHDMNNVLQNIKSSMQLGMINLEEDDCDLHKIKELFEIINEQTIRGAKLVQNIRKISNVENEEETLTKIDLCRYLQKALQSVRDSNQSRDLEIKIHSDITEAYVNANNFIEDLFENILINAIKYNDSSPVKVDITIENKVQDQKNYIKLVFEDNGIGIENGRKAMIFEPMSNQSKTSSGLGVGLSLVKKIIETYNGKIWVENKIQNDYSKGSKFIVMLPRAEL